MASLICGSMAYDIIMAHPEKFSDSLLAEHINNLNVCFLVHNVRKEFGGCAGNVAYNLKLLEDNPIIMATLGSEDGIAYFNRLEKLNLSTQYIKTIENSFTAQAFITTDTNNNQITLFHPGAMDFSHLNHIGDVKKEDAITLAIISPDGRDGMINHARECYEANIPFIFDPGQGLPMFNKEELLTFIEQSTYIILNSYESNLLSQNVGLSIEEIASKVKALIVTRSEDGAYLYADGKRIDIASVKADKIVDPTGCGDAFRAGFMYGVTHNLSLEDSAKLGSLMGSIKISTMGGQNHTIAGATNSSNLSKIDARFKQAFGYSLLPLLKR